MARSRHGPRYAINCSIRSPVAVVGLNVAVGDMPGGDQGFGEGVPADAIGAFRPVLFDVPLDVQLTEFANINEFEDLAEIPEHAPTTVGFGPRVSAVGRQST